MKAYLVLCPVIAGSAIVIQNGINSILSGGQMKLGTVLLFNCLISVAAVVLLSQIFPAFFGMEWSDLKSVTPWVLIPGLCGVLIISLLPFSFQSIGASKTLAILIAVQLFGAALWDLLVRKDTISFQRWVGVLITLGGAFITVKT